MLNFLNDYSEGCAPEILEALNRMNYEKNPGYGLDAYCSHAQERIRRLCNMPEAQVYFLTGGTQSNQVVIDSLLDAFDGVVSADSGHVAVHEAGAIEYTGHKVFTLPGRDGKIEAARLKAFIADYYADSNYEHMVRPGMVYISHPSEVGTLYTLEELRQIRAVCDEYRIPLFLDGARLACALTAAQTDVTLEDIAKLTDVFYIGGTKCGALYGEAVVWTRSNMPFRFNTRVKQHGAMLAKGWLPGLQFDVLLSDPDAPDELLAANEIGRSLYYRGGDHANRLAERIKAALREKGYRFYVDSPTNQIFIILENDRMEDMERKVVCSFFEKYDDSHTVIRFVTSWATTEESVEELIRIL